MCKPKSKPKSKRKYVVGNKAVVKPAKESSEFILIHNAADRARMAGFAVVVFTPKELGNASPDKVEDMMVEYGWNAIDIFDTEEENEF